MTNTEILNEYFIWEENNSIEPKMKSENKTESEQNDSTKNIKIVNELENWKTITDPKLRKKMRDKARYEANKDKIKARYEVNKDKIKLQKKARYEANKDKIKARYEANKDTILLKKKAYYEANKDKEKLRKKAYREASRDKINKYNRERRNTDTQFKLINNLRSRLRGAIKDNYKSGSAVEDLGCTIAELKTHLESKFQPGMTWDNYGYYGWHIDHIKPLASFDLNDRKQLLEACHYTNLQPLWAKDNLIKSNN